jgi:hypothetical protein
MTGDEMADLDERYRGTFGEMPPLMLARGSAAGGTGRADHGSGGARCGAGASAGVDGAPRPRRSAGRDEGV